MNTRFPHLYSTRYSRLVFLTKRAIGREMGVHTPLNQACPGQLGIYLQQALGRVERRLVSGLTSVVTANYRETHEHVLAAVEGLSDEQFAWQSGPSGHSIAWNLWHIARWADVFQANMPARTAALAQRLGPGRQLWEAEDLAASWGLDPALLGYKGTGMLMDDEASPSLALLSKEALLTYARRVFEAARTAVDAIDDEQFQAVDAYRLAEDPSSSARVGDVVISFLVHDNRHLGEIECLRGLLGLRGSVTR